LSELYTHRQFANYNNFTARTTQQQSSIRDLVVTARHTPLSCNSKHKLARKHAVGCRPPFICEVKIVLINDCRGRHLSYQRGKRNTNPGTSLIQIEGVADSKAANFYLGKKVAFVYRAHKEIRGTKIRVIWGKVTRTHALGNSGIVRAQFRRNLPPKSFGASVRIMLYPSSI
ncbi:hypothetical protein Golomagni_00717, partial [Golovinomyces magnicellulatus]